MKNHVTNPPQAKATSNSLNVALYKISAWHPVQTEAPSPTTVLQNGHCIELRVYNDSHYRRSQKNRLTLYFCRSNNVCNYTDALVNVVAKYIGVSFTQINVIKAIFFPSSGYQLSHDWIRFELFAPLVGRLRCNFGRCIDSHAAA